MLSKIEEKRTMYTGSTLDPNNFQSAADFRTAIQTIDTSLYLILSPQKKLAKRAATEEAQLTFVEALESLKKQIIEHPNYSIFQEKEKQEKFKEVIEKQGKIIKNNEQLINRVTSIIPNNDPRIKNKDQFLANFVNRIFNGTFDDTAFYGDYQRYRLGGMVLGVLDLKQKHDCYALILNVPYNIDKTLCIYRLSSFFAKNKDPIESIVMLDKDYFLPQKSSENVSSS